MFSFIGFIGVLGMLLGTWYWIEQRKSNWKRGMIITIASTILCIAGFGLQSFYKVIFAEQIAEQNELREKEIAERENERSKETDLTKGIEDFLSSKHDVNELYIFLNDGELSITGYFDEHNGLDYYLEL